MTERRLVQFLPIVPPVWQVLIHQGYEPSLWCRFNKMHEFVDDKVLEAMHWLLGEFEVQPDPPVCLECSFPTLSSFS